VFALDRDRYRDIVTRGFRDGIAYDIDYALEAADGVRREIRESGRPVLEDGRYARFLVTAQDVTEQVLAARELARKTAELEELNRQKDKLFSIIAHDLRNPLNSVVGFAELLAARSHELSPGKVATYAHMVRDAAAGVHELIENLLAWGACQIRDGGLNREPFHLGDAAAEGLAPLMHMAEAKGIQVVNGIGGVQALGDEALVRIVFRNLVSNAIKFSRQGDIIQVTAEQVDAAEGADPMVRVTVRDDGIGLSAAASAALFELGNTHSSPGTRGEKGTGLGLYLCRDIVCRHGGVISVDSSPGAGAAFNFTLPVIP
jgi:signal transduction histidine kinase